MADGLGADFDGGERDGAKEKVSARIKKAQVRIRVWKEAKKDTRGWPPQSVGWGDRTRFSSLPLDGVKESFFLLNFGAEFWHNDDGLYCGFLLISFGEFPPRVMCFWSF